MRLLIWHVDYFRSEVTERGRSPLVEPVSDRVTELHDGLLVLAAVEAADAAAPERVAARAAEALADVARRVGAQRLLLHSFAHLFTELAPPAAAVALLDAVVAAMRVSGFEVGRTPFGWFNTLEIRAKGHPLSRVARQIVAE